MSEIIVAREVLKEKQVGGWRVVLVEATTEGKAIGYEVLYFRQGKRPELHHVYLGLTPAQEEFNKLVDGPPRCDCHSIENGQYYRKKWQ